MALPKLFQRIFWHNNTNPAINETNLNAISKGLSDVDDRVISLASTIMEEVPAIIDGLDNLDDAVASAQNAATSASESVGMAQNNAQRSEAYATGTINGVAVTNTDPAYHNNSKYYAETVAQEKVDAAQNKSIDAEAWANGTRNGQPVPSTDPAYHNNSKYWSGQSAGQTFSGLRDVDIDDSTLVDGQVPTYNSTTEKWENKTISATSKMNNDGSNAASLVTFSGSTTVGVRRSGGDVGTRSFVNGQLGLASGTNSHAAGEYCTASGNNTYAGGVETVAEYNNQFVCGQYNSNKVTTIFEVGCGASDNARSNGFEIYNDGSLSTNNGTTKSKLPVIKSATLTAGATTVSFTNMPTTSPQYGAYLIDYHTSQIGLEHDSISSSDGGATVVLTYPAQQSDVTVFAVITEVTYAGNV